MLNHVVWFKRLKVQIKSPYELSSQLSLLWSWKCVVVSVDFLLTIRLWDVHTWIFVILKNEVLSLLPFSCFCSSFIFTLPAQNKQALICHTTMQRFCFPTWIFTLPAQNKQAFTVTVNLKSIFLRVKKSLSSNRTECKFTLTNIWIVLFDH